MNDAQSEIDRLEQKQAIFLLKEALFFINNVPNKKYPVRNFKDSYELAKEIDEYFRSIGIENPFKDE
jgi:hypothetical protein